MPAYGEGTYTPVAGGEALHRLVPHSALAVVGCAAHLPDLEQPERFNAALPGFLATPWTGTGPGSRLLKRFGEAAAALVRAVVAELLA
ncbi:hypothetical protein AB0N06_29510, partial [Streptomyces sp. NPDC051020]